MKSTTGSLFGLLGALACAVLFVASCGNSDAVGANESASAVAIESTSTTTALPTTTTSLKVYAATAFDQTDVLMTERVASAGLSGGMVRIGRADGSVIHEKSIGAVRGSTPLSVASSTKWLTAATFMTFVDQGAIGLDDNIAKWLPEFSNDAPPVTPRQLYEPYLRCSRQQVSVRRNVIERVREGDCIVCPPVSGGVEVLLWQL